MAYGLQDNLDQMSMRDKLWASLGNPAPRLMGTLGGLPPASTSGLQTAFPEIGTDQTAPPTAGGEAPAGKTGSPLPYLLAGLALGAMMNRSKKSHTRLGPSDTSGTRKPQTTGGGATMPIVVGLARFLQAQQAQEQAGQAEAAKAQVTAAADKVKAARSAWNALLREGKVTPEAYVQGIATGELPTGKIEGPAVAAKEKKPITSADIALAERMDPESAARYLSERSGQPVEAFPKEAMTEGEKPLTPAQKLSASRMLYQAGKYKEAGEMFSEATGMKVAFSSKQDVKNFLDTVLDRLSPNTTDPLLVRKVNDYKAGRISEDEMFDAWADSNQDEAEIKERDSVGRLISGLAQTQLALAGMPAAEAMAAKKSAADQTVKLVGRMNELTSRITARNQDRAAVERGLPAVSEYIAKAAASPDIILSNWPSPEDGLRLVEVQAKAYGLSPRDSNYVALKEAIMSAYREAPAVAP